MKKFKAILLACVFALSLSSCYTIEHTVGSGAKGSEEITQRQWFAIWGLVPITDVDSKAMAGGAKDYTIQSQQTFIDAVIGAFTGMVTIYPRTIKVTK